MTKKDFVDLYAKLGDFATKAEAERKANAFIAAVEEALKKGEEVAFLGFGKFKVVERKARTCINPQTGKTMDVPAKKAVKFTPGKDLSTLVNK